MRVTDIAIETLREALRLEPDTGRLFWKMRPIHHFVSYKGWAVWNAKHAGTEACTAINDSGYKIMQITLGGLSKMLKGHRVVFALHHGRWPAGKVDHKNLAPADNRPDNLREATNSQQEGNKRANPRNLTGLKGVSKRRYNYEARISIDGKQIALGWFKTAEQAHAAYVAAAVEHFGEFARS